MRKLCEKSFRFLLSTVLIFNMFLGLGPIKVNGVSIDSGDGTPENPYVISTPEQLDAVRNNLSASYKLANDIDITDYINKKYGIKGWQPIGRDGSSESFNGSFDGGGYKISGLRINRPDENFVGLFGKSGEGSIIKYVRLVLSSEGVIGCDSVGGLMGCSFSIIEGCSVEGGPLTGMRLIGKLVGENQKTVTLCYTTGELVTSNSTDTTTGDEINGAGGLIGRVGRKNEGDKKLVANCFSMCDVKSENSVCAGGLVGWCGDSSEIYNCYAGGNITSTWTTEGEMKGHWMGGFVGHPYYRALIHDCYAMGSLHGVALDSGGFSGITHPYSTINNCYVCCEEAISTEAFVGYITANTRLDKCYYDIDKGIKRAKNGGRDRPIHEKTTEEMHRKETYEGWDFESIWDIKEGEGYPYLRSNLPLYYSFGPRSTVYNGAAQNVKINKNVCGEVAGVGNVTSVEYSGSSSKPVNAGEYDVSVNLGAGSNTNAATNVKLLGSYVIEKAKLTLDHFKYDLSPVSYEEGVERPVTLSAKPGTVFTDEINDLINNGKIWVEYKIDGGNWTRNAPTSAATYEVRVVVGSEATNFKAAEYSIGNYLVGEKRSIIYKNYDGTDITEIDPSLPTEYIEGTEVSIPQTAPNSEMADWDFLGYWNCALDNSQDSLVDLEGAGYENEKSLDFEKGEKVEIIPKDSKGDVTVFARYTSKMFDADINGRENYIFASPGVFPNGTTASMRVLTPGTEEYEQTFNDVDKKDKHNVKIVEFEVFNKNGEKIQPKTFFGDTVVGFKVPEDFEFDNMSLVRVTSGEDINLRSNIWSDPENPELRYIEGTTDHFSPYAILSPWIDFLDAQEGNFAETGEANWALILCVMSFIVVAATISVVIYRKRHQTEKFKF